MKKFFSFLLCFFLVTNCYAEISFNVNDYTEDELIDIVNIISEHSSKLGYLYPNDEIVVGVDIPAGQYEFWIEENDISFGTKMIEQNLNYHCQNTLLCMVLWGDNTGGSQYTNVGYFEFYFDQYGDHRTIELREGQVIAATAISGVNFKGVRMKYTQNRKSGLFGD
ncbi:MAG: hypothetical protein IJB69_10505 [Clostridia bacterium]|nr:hypothetical protein [Clostridia bacterium]